MIRLIRIGLLQQDHGDIKIGWTGCGGRKVGVGQITIVGNGRWLLNATTTTVVVAWKRDGGDGTTRIEAQLSFQGLECSGWW